MKKQWIPAVCAALLMTGCVNDFNEDDFIRTQPEVMKSIVIDDNLSKDLRIIQTAQLKTEEGVEGVSIRARLKREGLIDFVFDSGKKVEFSYKFSWYDAQGKEVSTKNEYPWQTLFLYPGEEFSTFSTAPAKGISKVKFEIRRGAAPVRSAAAVNDGKGKGSKKLMERELPAEIREGKSTTTKEIKEKTDAVEKKNETLKEINKKIEKKNKKK